MTPRRLTDHVTVLDGERGGRYPHGNSLLVQGPEESLLIDPSLDLATLVGTEIPVVDRILNSHCHEDHVAGNRSYPDTPVWLHELDAMGLRSLDDMMAIYGFGPGTIDEAFRPILVDEFHWVPRPDATAFSDGATFDLGGGVQVRAVHAPGHTRGHCFFVIEPDEVVYLGDVDLSSFGPYYGDAWSDLPAFESSLALARSQSARHYATFHHIGVLDGRAAFLERLERYEAVIGERERRLLEFLGEPRTIDDITRHRFIYRPTDEVLFADPVERRSMGQHLERLLARGEVSEVAPATYRRT